MNSNLLLLPKFMIILIMLSPIFVVFVTAQSDLVCDDFSRLDEAKWTVVTSETWQIINGTIQSSTYGRSILVFQNWEYIKYIVDVDLTANQTPIQNYAQVGFYL